MPSHDFRSPRLYVDHPLGPGMKVTLDAAQSHYLADVLRRRPGDQLMVFNGRDGEWRAVFEPAGKRGAVLALEEQTRVQDRAGDLAYLFAPLKRARLDYTVQKAVEMGAARLTPVITRYTQVERVNTERMRANAIEAAEQCSILTLPAIDEPLALDRALAALEPARTLVFCDEDAPIADPLAALAPLRGRESVPLAVLIGPEGGFAPEERALLLGRSNTIRLALGPRILRADTAAVAALTLVQAALGDWAERSA
ncbi:MAG: 16S rRNA (uracil(1498)-N(3))-methyltransferase [Xanthobacteraceae bacterium]